MAIVIAALVRRHSPGDRGLAVRSVVVVAVVVVVVVVVIGSSVVFDVPVLSHRLAITTRASIVRIREFKRITMSLIGDFP